MFLADGDCCAPCALQGIGDEPQGAARPANNHATRHVANLALALGLVASAITVGKLFMTPSVRRRARRARYTGHRIRSYDRTPTLELPAESMTDVVFERRR